MMRAKISLNKALNARPTEFSTSCTSVVMREIKSPLRSFEKKDKSSLTAFSKTACRKFATVLALKLS